MAAKQEQQTGMRTMRCLRCLQVVECSRYDTDALLTHIKDEHPEIFEQDNDKIKNLYKLAAEHGVSEERVSQIGKMTGMTEAQMADEAERYIAKHPSSGGSKAEVSAEQQSVGSSKQRECAAAKARANAKAADKTPNGRRQCYRASIERWIPVDGCLYCPSCGTSRRPVVKSRTEVITSTGCAASCVISCWPLCFLPCLVPPENREYLYCSNCKTFLGIYDREKNCVKPSKEFVPSSCVCPKTS
ncbi:uncharacterized protein LOC117582235 [Drosophila guanche]|uniref:LITAF domain-containing protein n=1 Tax=Drosophila guanche TaxID=7266 RepID=A0A3B0J1S6_DROGU|nr:uncharacterized protein LOC117582235 [Drosophila guanche]XP_034125746.1 uncharacterized protein LOC117582235 [Drosophila guanche]SPP72872.1 Hypothetical predicted protein [Drosophila guanche]